MFKYTWILNFPSRNKCKKWTNLQAVRWEGADAKKLKMRLSRIKGHFKLPSYKVTNLQLAFFLLSHILYRTYMKHYAMSFKATRRNCFKNNEPSYYYYSINFKFRNFFLGIHENRVWLVGKKLENFG